MSEADKTERRNHFGISRRHQTVDTSKLNIVKLDAAALLFSVFRLANSPTSDVSPPS